METISRFILGIIKGIKAIQVRLLLFIYKLIFKNFKIGVNVKFNGLPFLRLFGKTIFGDNLVFNSKTQYNTVGLFKNCSIYVDRNARLVIGDHSGFSGVSIHCQNSITIGQYCNFGGNVCIWDTDFHSLDYKERRVLYDQKMVSKPIEIGNDVFIGANSIILKGVRIGDRAIVGAGSVVTRDIKQDEIWAGNPAKFIRSIY